MSQRSEIETVLANWIRNATSPPGQLPTGTDPAAWIASRFLAWWWDQVERPLDDAEVAASVIREELISLGGWESFGDALHEHIHLTDALAELRGLLGCGEERHADSPESDAPPAP